MPPASDTVLREGSKPKAETQLCGSVHESPVRFTARAVALIGIVGCSDTDSIGEDRLTCAGMPGKTKLLTKFDVVGDPFIYLSYKPTKFLDRHKPAPNWLQSFQVYGLNHSRFWRAIGRVP